MVPCNEELFTGLGGDASVSSTKIIIAMIQEQAEAEDTTIPLLALKAGDMEIVEAGEAEFQPEDKVLALVKRTSEKTLRDMLRTLIRKQLS